ncbi:hypothetical protein D9601_11080 [Sphingomonas sp. MA1305]|uniref:hypothetical protein n=1 Tax=Sphingomonas sp. MA1305 TaxID=2479204 RepID=UPI0018DF8DDA|nr:hypothetical protein [Sphingomonas sp. MA1305]MBI0475895.1 hypothetical protein [Sphingomonas sp. MA1305]
MPVPFANNIGLIVAGAAASAAPALSLRFEQAFPTATAPRAFHARIRYRGPDGVHDAELWRDGATRLRRDTDGRLITVATRSSARDPAFRMAVIDTRRHIRTLVDRDSLYRVGRFTDWDDLAYGLRRPAGTYRLRALVTAPAAITTIAPCRWIALDQSGRTSFICWSRAHAYPLVMLDTARRPIWRVTALDTRRPADALFHPNTAHYIVNDAAADIRGD